MSTRKVLHFLYMFPLLAGLFTLKFWTQDLWGEWEW